MYIYMCMYIDINVCSIWGRRIFLVYKLLFQVLLVISLLSLSAKMNFETVQRGTAIVCSLLDHVSNIFNHVLDFILE